MVHPSKDPGKAIKGAPSLHLELTPGQIVGIILKGRVIYFNICVLYPELSFDCHRTDKTNGKFAPNCSIELTVFRLLFSELVV